MSDEQAKRYNKRTWLNPESSHFTGSITCHDAVVSNQGRPAARYTFVEIADCHKKTRIHLDENFSIGEFVEKLRLVNSEIQLFIDHLERP